MSGQVGRVAVVDIRTADVMGALSLAADLATGLPAEHAMRSCYMGMGLAKRLKLTPSERTDLYYTGLLMDAGCTAWKSQMAAFLAGDEIAARRDLYFFTNRHSPLDMFLWLSKYLAPDAPVLTRLGRGTGVLSAGDAFTREGFRNTCEVAQLLAARMGMPEPVQRALLSVFEQWDGNGPDRASGASIPLVARIVSATSYLEVFHRVGGRTAALELARSSRGSAFDPLVVDAFLEIADDSFWEPLEAGSVWDLVVAMEPVSELSVIDAAQFDEVALSFADFADIKSPHLAGHSRRVGELAARLAEDAGLDANSISTVRTAGLMHNLGMVAVPSFLLGHADSDVSPVEREQLCLHPHLGERIVARIQGLEPVAELVAAHHERHDGTGYPRGLAGGGIPVGARLIAVADAFDKMTHDSPGYSALDTRAALDRIASEVGHAYAPDACAALSRVLTEPGARVAPRVSAWPASLTNREVDVLRLVARGMSRKQMAGSLALSEATVRHHMEHIYAKIGVSTRVAAALSAIEHGLVE